MDRAAVTYFTLPWLRVGMVSQETVTSPAGKVLVQAGAMLTAEQLHALRASGVKGMEITPPAGAVPSRSLPDARELAPPLEERLRERFRHQDFDHPLIRALVRQCVLREMLENAEADDYDS
jgi:hypothetical protein